MLTKRDVYVPLDVPYELEEEYVENFLSITRSTGRVMLFAGDQKIEHLNSDFYGTNISLDDSDPEHLFMIAKHGTIGAFATQLGLIARYGRDYKEIPYVVKLNSKTNLYKGEPYSEILSDVSEVMEFKRNSRLRILGVGYTIYLGSQHEYKMLSIASRVIREAHKNGLIAIVWIYPRGRYIKNEKTPEIIAGATGVAVSLGADFVKVNYPFAYGKDRKEAFKQAIRAAGRTGVICAGGSAVDVWQFLKTLHDQLNAGSRGNATGRNIHQRPFEEAVRLTEAISALVYGNRNVEEAYAVYEGRARFKL
jgi:fructose-bisphosphate aldolase/6-deoxy-5-ketofructose 1-phosphate synthase